MTLKELKASGGKGSLGKVWCLGSFSGSISGVLRVLVRLTECFHSVDKKK